MKVMVIGASGVIGSAVAAALADKHEVVAVSRSSSPAVDLGSAKSVAALFAAVDGLDAVVCCAANTPLGDFSAQPDAEFERSVAAKLLGQISVARHAARHLRDGGSITLTSEAIPEGMLGSAGGAMVNAGLEAFVHAAALDLARGLRINAVSPGWVAETLADLGMDPADGTPAAEVARAYVTAVRAPRTAKCSAHNTAPAGLVRNDHGCKVI
jgi:NAD(P)-dependent dehydrogenase (short-subunit alcohol dehydrogenase family)